MLAQQTHVHQPTLCHQPNQQTVYPAISATGAGAYSPAFSGQLSASSAYHLLQAGHHQAHFYFLPSTTDYSGLPSNFTHPVFLPSLPLPPLPSSISPATQVVSPATQPPTSLMALRRSTTERSLTAYTKTQSEENSTASLCGYSEMGVNEEEGSDEAVHSDRGDFDRDGPEKEKIKAVYPASTQLQAETNNANRESDNGEDGQQSEYFEDVTNLKRVIVSDLTNENVYMNDGYLSEDNEEAQTEEETEVETNEEENGKKEDNQEESRDKDEQEGVKHGETKYKSGNNEVGGLMVRDQDGLDLVEEEECKEIEEMGGIEEEMFVVTYVETAPSYGPSLEIICHTASVDFARTALFNSQNSLLH
ncbi:unnamed protein product [Protopolystoma xenopodis]|uniref:Uncharacterized protein n=1 Tax=Protopolystoma xenopodis TaxID=117903 RepID=A0A448XFZ3_9PLAT|nr:unnamed protein product [Protopolystoma xenopodis]